MKKGVVVVGFLFLSLMFVSITSAACASSDQTILKLYSSNNTHGALWNDTFYTQDICYNTIFGINYTGANPHYCTTGAGNSVLKLSNITNAHAEISSSNAFPNPVSVCYGNLVCGSYASCPVGSNEIVRLSNTTNAHLSIAGQNPGNVYNTVICCSSAVGVANWKDMVGNIINLKNVSVNNTVILQIQGLQAGLSLTFQIFERNVGAVSGRTFTGITSDSSGNASVRWKITDADMAGRARNEFYFNVTGTDLSVSSPSLYANNTRTNVAPKCAIISPILGSIHPSGESIALRTNPNAEDTDSVVTINWKLVNESTNTEEVNINNESVTYTTIAGTKTIILNVTDDAGASCYNTTAISVFAPVATGQNPRTEVFAWINYPLENQIIQAPDYRADYNARESYAYNVTPGNCGNLVCVAGACPTVSIPCGGGSISMAASSSPDYSSLNFGWTFDGTFSSVSSGMGKSNGSRIYPSSGDKIIRLALGHGSASDVKTRRFNLMNGCEYSTSGDIAYRVSISNGQLVRYDTRSVTDACTGSPSTTEDDCCPVGGWICANDPIRNGNICQQPAISAATCSDYMNSSDCNSDRQHVGNNESYFRNAQSIYDFYNCSRPFSSGGRDYIVICGELHFGSGGGCVWYDDSCRLNVSLQDQVYPHDVFPGCLYESTLGECVGGYQSVTITGVNFGGNILDCASLNREEVVLCGRTGVKLPFFGVFQFVIALLIIVLVYYLIRRNFFKKTKHRKK